MYSITDNLYINIKYRLSMQYTNRLYMNIAYRLTVSNADRLSADMCTDCRWVCVLTVDKYADSLYVTLWTVSNTMPVL